TDTIRSFDVAAWLAAQTSLAGQPWRWTNATIVPPTNANLAGLPLTITLQVADTNLAAARITWEALGQEPVFGGLNYTFTPVSQEGLHWVEAEVQWPDGRRAFATNYVIVSTNAPPQLIAPQFLNGQFLVQLAGTPQAAYVLQASVDLKTW